MGEKLARFIIQKRKWIETIFFAGCIFSAVAMLFVNVNYDLTKYVPADAQSSRGLEVMKKDFGYPGTARVMLKDVTLYEAKQYKDKLAAVDGVDQVLWCDSTVNVYAGEDFINMDEIEDYYKDGCAVMDITFDEESDSERTEQAIDEMKAITGDKGCFVGMAVQNKSLIETTGREMSRILVVAVIMIFVVLCFSTTAWTEPILFMLVMGVAVLLNKGTNVFLGTISFLTDNVAIILQLATSMDYSIFLLDAFMRWRDSGLSDEEAITKAVEEAINSIFASSLTTIVGFLALVTMKFNIGFDMGLVLAKGIVFSLVSVVFFMPAMILKFEKVNDKTKHRSFFPDFSGLGRLIYRFRYAVLAAVLLITPPSYVAQGMNHFLYGNSAVGGAKGTQVYDDDQEITARFGRSNMLLLVYPNNDMVAEKQLSDAIEALPYVKSVTSMANTLPEGIPEDFLPYGTTSQLHTEDTARMLLYIRTKGESDKSFQYTDEIRDLMKQYYPENSYVVGETPSTQDIKATITEDNARVNILSLLGVFLVVMGSFRSVLIPVVVMIPIEVAIFLNMAIPYIQGVDMVYMGYIIVSSIQLGATVDYSILLTNNYIAKRRTLPKREACVEAIARSCPSIFTSGAIITLAGYIVHLISTTAAIGDLGHLIGRGGLLSMIFVLTLLPSLLVLSDRFIIEKDWKRPRRFLKERYNHRVQQFHRRAERIRTRLELKTGKQTGGKDHEI
ncbi:MAG: efflux RND transporter permease subunit [Eubacteriales bacterium]|nr:efflux RND transporter permease subunit [Eubacteriales bacterium]